MFRDCAILTPTRIERCECLGSVQNVLLSSLSIDTDESFHSSANCLNQTVLKRIEQANMQQNIVILRPRLRYERRAANLFLEITLKLSYFFGIHVAEHSK